jgi:polyribonucleotide nucleotidyltransferase
MHYVRESATLGGREISIETGRMAKQASAAVLIQQGEPMVLVTVVGAGDRPDLPFFPLVCDYIEKTYAAGFIPGGFFRREGRLAEHEILASRLIDRPIRPLFPDGYRGDTQVTATVISSDGQHAADVLSITGASTALSLSDVPWGGPLAGIRVGRIDGQWVANPTVDELATSELDLVMACTRDAIVMVEGEAKGISESDLLDALEFGHKEAQSLIDLQLRLQEVVGKDKREYAPPVINPGVYERVVQVAQGPLSEALGIQQKQERYARLDAIKKATVETLALEFAETPGQITEAYEKLKKRTMRQAVADTGSRMDGRRLDQVRPITSEVGLLPRTHGSALFTRGETQALVTVTFANERAEQRMETLLGHSFRHFLLHYNFPPFCVGEVKPLRGPGRREIGHGNLARRALEPMLPHHDIFPYTIRVVAEILESNGSSSMASVCGGSLALMDAGVPVESAVAGIAMGLIKEGDKYVVLSDILGDEDHLGDMDFKVAGTTGGITAIQMDIKIGGVSRQIMIQALEQARQGRLHILGEMAKTLSEPRADISPHAPRIVTITIKPDRIRDVIGPGGKNIRGIQEATQAEITVDDDGTVRISTNDEAMASKAIAMIRGLTAEPEIGAIYRGVVARTVDFGAFVTILPNLDGLVHISELSDERVEKTTDVCHEGDEMIVKCIGLERGGKIKLSRKEALGQKPTISALE